MVKTIIELLREYQKHMAKAREIESINLLEAGRWRAIAVAFRQRAEGLCEVLEAPYNNTSDNLADILSMVK